MRIHQRWFALTTLLAIAPLAESCGGTSVFDAVDPKACGSGHGCPTAACLCNDGSAVLDTTCELGSCRDSQALCEERCDSLEGLASVIESSTDEVALPQCEQICARVEINGCELGCDTLFSECVPPTSCSDAAKSFWDCVASDAVFSCRDNAVRVEGCDTNKLAFCEG